MTARAYWDRRLDPLDWRSPAIGGDDAWRRAAAAWVAPDTAAALAALGDLRGRDVLELACGAGHGTSHLVARGARVVGVDLSPLRCADARRRVDASFVAADAARLPLGDACVDAILARDLLMYTGRDAALRECARVVRPGGVVVVSEALCGNPAIGLWRRLADDAGHRALARHLSLHELRATSIAGLELTTLSCHDLLTVPAWAALFVLRAHRLHAVALRALAAGDTALLRAAPGLGRFAWRAVARFTRPA